MIMIMHMICVSNILKHSTTRYESHSHCGYESPNQYENNYYSKH
ncbi:MAG: hypothetical protein ACLTTH_02755 [Holdemanella porci]